MAFLPSKLKQARKSLGLTQAEAASGCGITRTHFCNIEKGKAKPSFGALEKMASTFCVAIGYFFDEQHVNECDYCSDFMQKAGFKKMGEGIYLNSEFGVVKIEVLNIKNVVSGLIQVGRFNKEQDIKKVLGL